jgi:hypothetical protein
MKKTTKILGALSVMLVLSACDAPEKLSFDSVESARKQANENSEVNARTYRSNNPQFAGFNISMRGDSTQSEVCGQGDGWASIDLVDIDTKQKVPLKCSTVSAAIGCLTTSDFEHKVYSSTEGKCDRSIPFPLPKILK